MVIKRSTGVETERLIQELVEGTTVEQATALARLSIVGTRAVDRLVRTTRATPDAAARARLLRALEGIPDTRSIRAAIDALDDDDAGVALAAVSVLAAQLRPSRAAIALRGIDALAALALDRQRPGAVRAAAIRALDTVMPTQRRSLAARLAKETNPDVLDAVAHLSGADGDAGDSDRALADAASGRLSGADVLKRHLARAGSRQPLPVLDDLLKVVVARAARIRDPEEAAEWLDVRAGLHAALASRGSRLGLYDLRDALDAWQEPQPRAFITAARAVGDASCLEPLGRAFARVRSEWSRHDILLACRDILRRERLTRRHQVVRRLVRQAPALAAVLWPTKAQGSGLRAQGGSRP